MRVLDQISKGILLEPGHHIGFRVVSKKETDPKAQPAKEMKSGDDDDYLDESRSQIHPRSTQVQRVKKAFVKIRNKNVYNITQDKKDNGYKKVGLKTLKPLQVFR